MSMYSRKEVDKVIAKANENMDKANESIQKQNEFITEQLETIEKLEQLVQDSFEDGYAKAEDRVSRGDSAWEYSHTHDVLRKITGVEFYTKEW